MKAISLWQPWASLVALGYKQYETRSWSTGHRGRLLIHAAKKRSKEIDRLVLEEPHFRRFMELERLAGLDELPFGAIVCTCDLVYCVESGLAAVSATERAFGDYTPGRFAWKLAGVMKLESPIAFTGRQGLFDVARADLRKAVHDGNV